MNETIYLISGIMFGLQIGLWIALKFMEDDLKNVCEAIDNCYKVNKRIIDIFNGINEENGNLLKIMEEIHAVAEKCIAIATDAKT